MLTGCKCVRKILLVSNMHSICNSLKENSLKSNEKYEMKEELLSCVWFYKTKTVLSLTDHYTLDRLNRCVCAKFLKICDR